MNHTYQCEYSNVVLRPLNLEDSLVVRVIRNARKDAFVYDSEIGEESQRKWFQSYLERDDECMFSIYCEDSLVGQVGLYEIDESTGTCEFGRLVVDASYSGRKLGLHSTIGACLIAFKDLKLDVVKLEVLTDNEPAKAVYAKVGFKQTGIITLEDGRAEYAMELSRDDFLERWES